MATVTWTGPRRLLGVVGIALVAGVLVGCGLLPSPSTVTSDDDPPGPTPVSVDGDCPAVSPPNELRITEVVVPDIDTGPFGRPVIAGCAVWITSGDNFGGIHRVELATGAVTNVSPIEVVWEVDTDGEDLFAVGRTGSTIGDVPSTLFRIDPVTSEILGRLPVDLHGQTLRIVDGRAWLAGWRMGLKIYDLPSGAVAAEWPVGDMSGTMEVGAHAVWMAADQGEGQVGLSRIDRSTLEATNLPAPRDLTDIAVVGDAVYVGTESGAIARLDPTTGNVLSSIQIEGWTGGFLNLTSDGTSIWVLPIQTVPFGSEFRLVSSGFLRVDAATGQFVGRIEYEASQPIELWATEGNLWLYEADKMIHRFELPASN
jgi:hypothetical protein